MTAWQQPAKPLQNEFNPQKVVLELEWTFTYDTPTMKNRYKILALLIGLSYAAAVTGCAKDKITIGKDSPQVEIQKCMQLSEKKKFEEAIECLEIFKSKFPQTEYGLEAELAIADSHFDNKEYLLAADTYNAFIKLHPTSPKMDYAYYRLGLSYLKESPKSIDRDQQYLDDAIFYLRSMIVGFPSSPYHESAVTYLKDARTRIAKRTYYIGNFYYKNGEYRAAIPRFIDVVNEFPETEVVPKSLYKLVVSAGKLQMIPEAKAFYSKLNADFPDNDLTKKAESKLESYIKKYGEGRQSAPMPTEETGVPQ